MLLAGFDRASAPALGGRPLATELMLLALVASAIVVAVQALGNLLVVALLVGPASVARLFADRVVPMMCVATLTAIAGGAGGLYLSYYAGTAGGASIAAAIVGLYLAGLALTTVSGRSESPGKCRALKPVAGRGLGRQRGPLPPGPEVSKRRPATTR